MMAIPTTNEDQKRWLIINLITDARSNLDDLFEDIEEQKIIQNLHVMLEKRFDEESEEWRDAF